MIKLRELLVCNLVDVHLVHADEEVKSMTIDELNGSTLTNDGKAAWADVLNADVNCIFNGIYGTNIDLSGVRLQRVSSFSQMLTGNILCLEYDKWVNESTTESLEMR